MYAFIINPVAGNGKGLQVFNIIKQTKEFQRIKTDCYFTEGKGHAEGIARSFVEEGVQYKGIFVLGGDGTINEVTNAIVNSELSMIVIQTGSGNDFARGARLESNSLTLFKQALQTRSVSDYTVGSYECIGKQRFFINCIGFGFDAVIAQSVNRSRLKKTLNKFKIGALIYPLTVLRNILSYKPVKLTVEADGKAYEFTKVFLLTLNNHPYLGGGMKMNPTASPEKQHLSMIVVDSIAKWKVFALFFTVFLGWHTKLKEVQIIEAKKFVLTSERIILYQVDGESGATSHCTIRKGRDYISLQGIKE